MEGLDALGNAGVVPIIILLTQLIKRKIGDFRYGSDVLALLLSFILCIGWEFYYMAPEAYVLWSSLNGLELFKWVISDVIVVGFATWLAASKIYDLGHGNKKRAKRAVEEKEILEKEIVVLQNGNGDNNGNTVEETDLSSRLREILEEGS